MNRPCRTVWPGDNCNALLFADACGFWGRSPSGLQFQRNIHDRYDLGRCLHRPALGHRRHNISGIELQIIADMPKAFGHYCELENLISKSILR